jgi:hypothetical protein
MECDHSYEASSYTPSREILRLMWNPNVHFCDQRALS